MAKKPLSLEEEWRTRLMGTNPGLRAGRRFFMRLPSPPRCELCASPFAGPFGPLMHLIGHGRWERNPRYCKACCSNLIRQKAGAQIPLSFLFADVRGSTTLGEQLGARGLHDLMDRFYEAGVAALFEHDALIDRFMGDQIVGYFVPGFAGPQHARRAVDCALEILRVTGHHQNAPWVPIGVGVHTGEAFVGAVGEGDYAELTAIGDSVNLAARLASVAEIGELVVSEQAFADAGQVDGAERRTVTLKGIADPVQVRVIRSGTDSARATAS